MKNNIDQKGKMHLANIDDHLIDLYHSGAEAERKKIMNELYVLVKEKEIRSDHDAVAIILWTIDRLNKEI
jgi:hypothetical protein